MDFERPLPVLTVGVIVVVSLVSGPLVGAVDLSSVDSEVPPGVGSADIEIISLPDEGRLVPVGYSRTGYHLSLPPASVDVSNLSGSPMVVYEIRVRELGYVASTTHFLDREFTGLQTLTLEDAVLNRTSLERETYGAEILVVKRVQERDTVLYRGNVTLRVQQ